MQTLQQIIEWYEWWLEALKKEIRETYVWEKEAYIKKYDDKIMYFRMPCKLQGWIVINLY